MYINNNRNKVWQWFWYLLGNLACLYCGIKGYYENNTFLIIAFQINLWLAMFLSVIAGFAVFLAPEKEDGKFADYLRQNGAYIWNWLEYIFEAAFIGILLWAKHPIIAAIYLAQAILLARIRFEVKKARYLATIKYQKNETPVD